MALAISAVPTVLRVRFEVLYLATVVLTGYIFALDLSSRRESDLWIGLRQCGSACAAILVLGLANQWLLPRPRFPIVSACILFVALMMLLPSTAFLLLRRSSRLRYRLSYLGAAIVATLVAVNFFQCKTIGSAR